MAIKKTTAILGVVVPNAYIKVLRVNGTKDSISFDAEIKAEKDSPTFFSQTYWMTPNMTGENFIRQAYLHLKTLPEFADAEDC